MVFWRKHESVPDSFEFDFATAVQGSACNELVFAGRVTGEVYDYVINQIRSRH